jgi:hypothetical protein
MFLLFEWAVAVVDFTKNLHHISDDAPSGVNKDVNCLTASEIER